MKTDIHIITGNDGATFEVRLDIFRMSYIEAILVLTVLRYMPAIPAGSLPALLNIDSVCAMGGDLPAAFGHK